MYRWSTTHKLTTLVRLLAIVDQKRCISIFDTFQMSYNPFYLTNCLSIVLFNDLLIGSVMLTKLLTTIFEKKLAQFQKCMRNF